MADPRVVVRELGARGSPASRSTAPVCLPSYRERPGHQRAPLAILIRQSRVQGPHSTHRPAARRRARRGGSSADYPMRRRCQTHLRRELPHRHHGPRGARLFFAWLAER